MSRIEKAMEKAARIRGSAERSPSVDKPPAIHRNQPRLEGIETVIERAMTDKYIVSVTEPQSTAAEQYRTLRARILKAIETKKDPVNTIMITSSDKREGKTITAINLAVAMASVIDYPVVLVDADLRNPSVHRYLGIEPEYGLSDYLTGKASLSDVLLRTGIGELIILPGGLPPENPAELLSSEKMKKLVHELKLRHREGSVIFDSSPILLTSDPLSLGSLMDGVLFIIHAALTSEKSASEAISLIKGCNILGIVFNDVQNYPAKDPYPYYSAEGKDKGSEQRKAKAHRAERRA